MPALLAAGVGLGIIIASALAWSTTRPGAVAAAPAASDQDSSLPRAALVRVSPSHTGEEGLQGEIIIVPPPNCEAYHVDFPPPPKNAGDVAVKEDEPTRSVIVYRDYVDWYDNYRHSELLESPPPPASVIMASRLRNRVASLFQHGRH